MCHQKYIPIQEYKNSIEKDDELKGDNITDEKEGIVEYGNDFLYCKIIHAKQI